MEDRYLSLDRYPFVDLGWQKWWLYVPNESPPLPSYSPNLLCGDLLVMGGTTTLGEHAGCALLVGCDHGPEGLGPDGDEDDPYLHWSSGSPLEDEAPPLVGVLRPD